MFIVGLIVGLFCGAIVGFIAYSLCVSTHNADAHLQNEEHNDPHP